MPTSDSILITGGFGFLGAHFASILLEQGFRVTLFDNADWSLSTACAMQLESKPGLKHVCGSVLSEADLKSLGTDFSYIAHAAGILGIKRVTEIPLQTMDVNILGTRNVLELASKQKELKRFLFFSTSEIYGQFASEPLENSTSKIPTQGARWCYATSKLAGEYFVRGFALEQNMPFVIVRPFNIYGPYRQGSNAMTELVRSAVRGEPITISGNGQQTRSWCHINDFVKGLLACLIEKEANREAFNIGNDKTYISILDLANLICEIVSSTSQISVSGSTEADVEKRLANINKARQLLKYDPQIDLDTGIRDVVAWLRG